VVVLAQTEEESAVRKTDPRARSLALFAPRLGNSYLAFGGFHGNVISAEDLRDEELDNPDLKRLLARGKNKEWIEWDEASEELWRAWFEHLSRRGVTALRVFPRRKVNGDVLDLCGKLNQPLVELMKRFFAAAQPYGIRFLLILMPEPDQSGYLKKDQLKKWVIPAYTKSEMANLPPAQKRFIVQQRTVTLADYFTDPDVWTCQRQYLDAALEWINNEPQIFALEIVNEQGWWDERFHWDLEEATVAWGSRVADYVHKRAPHIPICLSHPGFGILGYEPLRWSREMPVDFYSPHLYASLGGERRGMDVGLVTDLVMNYSSAVKPSFMGEWAVLSNKVNRRLRQLALRDAIWFSILNGSPGFFQWTNGAHYSFEYKKAREILEPLRLDKKERRRPLIGVDVTRTAAALAANDLYDNPKSDPWQLAANKSHGDAYCDLLRCTESFLNRGVAFDFTLSPDDYEVLAAPAQASEIQIPESECPFSFSPNYQCKYAAFGEWETIVAYFRNIEPVVAEGFNLRAQTPRPFQVAWGLPKRPRGAQSGPWHYRLTVYNLDADEVQQSRVARESSVDFGNAVANDFVFVFQR
jgi:hypothetical protein